MTKRLSLLAVFGLCLSGAQAQAAGYGAAGCGLGSIVFEGKHGMVQVLAATTNGTFGSQTFGISSGTSNCGGGGTSPTSVQYIEANKNALATDIAQGNGESLQGLAEILGCNDRGQLDVALQKNYRSIFPKSDIEANQVDASIRKVIQGNPQLKNSCKTTV